MSIAIRGNVAVRGLVRIGFIYGWQSAVAVSSIGDSIVSTTGKFVVAKNAGNASDKTVNGVVFAAATSFGAGWTAYSSSLLYQDGVVGTEFESILDSFAYESTGMLNNASFTVSGLTAGKTYMIQIFVSDDRVEYSGRTQYLTLGSYVSSSVLNSASYSRICIFTASATTQSVTVTSSAVGAPVVNGYQVRQID